MMFTVSKLLAGFLQPFVWVLALLALGLLIHSRKPAWGRRLTGTAAALFLLLGFEAIPDALIRSLESRYRAPAAETLGQYRGIIVLGGALEWPALSRAHQQVALNEAAERMTLPTAWMRRFDTMRLVFSGGEAALRPTGTSEASLARQFFIEQGVDASRLAFEDRSRTTRENARALTDWSLTRNPARWYLALHEWVGLLAYRLTTHRGESP